MRFGLILVALVLVVTLSAPAFAVTTATQVERIQKANNMDQYLKKAKRMSWLLRSRFKHWVADEKNWPRWMNRQVSNVMYGYTEDWYAVWFKTVNALDADRDVVASCDLQIKAWECNKLKEGIRQLYRQLNKEWAKHALLKDLALPQSATPKAIRAQIIEGWIHSLRSRVASVDQLLPETGVLKNGSGPGMKATEPAIDRPKLQYRWKQLVNHYEGISCKLFDSEWPQGLQFDILTLGERIVTALKREGKTVTNRPDLVGRELCHQSWMVGCWYECDGIVHPRYQDYTPDDWGRIIENHKHVVMAYLKE